MPRIKPNCLIETVSNAKSIPSSTIIALLIKNAPIAVVVNANAKLIRAIIKLSLFYLKVISTLT